MDKWLDSPEGRRIVRRLLTLVGGAMDLRGPHVRDGMRLDAQVRASLWLKKLIGMPKLSSFDAPKARRLYIRQIAPYDVSPRPMASIDECLVPGADGPLRARVLTPEGLEGPSPVLVWLHGGGFVIGDSHSHEASCRLLADEGRCRIILLEYRLAPEHPYPAAHEDALAAWIHIATHIEDFGGELGRLAIGGDSAGGNLAACVSIHATRSQAIPAPRFQTLIYPSTDFTRSSPSMTALSKGYILDQALLDWFLGQYGVPPSDNGLFPPSPRFAGSLKGLPRAYVATAGFDPLRDEGRGYAQAMAADGVPVEHRCFEGLIHGYMHLGGVVESAHDALLDAGRAIRTYFQA